MAEGKFGKFIKDAAIKIFTREATPEEQISDKKKEIESLVRIVEQNPSEENLDKLEDAMNLFWVLYGEIKRSQRDKGQVENLYSFLKEITTFYYRFRFRYWLDQPVVQPEDTIIRINVAVTALKKLGIDLSVLGLTREERDRLASKLEVGSARSLVRVKLIGLSNPSTPLVPNQVTHFFDLQRKYEFTCEDLQITKQEASKLVYIVKKITGQDIIIPARAN